MSLNFERMLGYLPDLLAAAVITVELTFLSIFIASVIGLGVALIRHARVPVANQVAVLLVEVVRNTPDLVQIYYIFYVLPVIGIRLAPFVAGVVALSLHFGAYLSEVFRAGISSIDRGQWEAAHVLEMSRFHTIRRIILPQALRRVLPSWANYFIGMFKSTSLVSAVAVQELLYRAKVIGAYNFRYYELFTLVAVVYFSVCYPSSRAVRWLERRQDLAAGTRSPSGGALSRWWSHVRRRPSSRA